MTTWTLTAENVTAAILRKLRESDSRVPAFPATGTRDENIYYRSDEADFAITASEDSDNPGWPPRWMTGAEELLTQYGIISRIIASDIDPAMRGTGTQADYWLRKNAETGEQR